MLVALLVLLTPWTIFASGEAGHLVPLSSGGASNLWVGTYLPGDGSIFGAKRALADEVAPATPTSPARRVQLSQVDVIAPSPPGIRTSATEAALRRRGS